MTDLPISVVRKIIRWFPMSLIMKTEEYPEILSIWRTEPVKFGRVFINEYTQDVFTYIEIFIEDFKVALKRNRHDPTHYFIARHNSKDSRVIWKLKTGNFNLEVIRGVSHWFNTPGIQFEMLYIRNSIFNEIFEFPVDCELKFLVRRDGDIQMSLPDDRKFTVSDFLRSVIEAENELAAHRRIFYSEKNISADETDAPEPLNSKIVDSILRHLPFTKKLECETELARKSDGYVIQHVEIVENANRNAFSIDIDEFAIGVQQIFRKSIIGGKEEEIPDFVQLRLGFYIAKSAGNYEETVQEVFDMFLNREATKVAKCTYKSLETVEKYWNLKFRPQNLEKKGTRKQKGFEYTTAIDVLFVRQMAETIEKFKWSIGMRQCSESPPPKYFLQKLLHIGDFNAFRTLIHPEKWGFPSISDRKGLIQLQAVALELKHCVLVVGASEQSTSTDEDGNALHGHFTFMGTAKRGSVPVVQEQWRSTFQIDGQKVTMDLS